MALGFNLPDSFILKIVSRMDVSRLCFSAFKRGEDGVFELFLVASGPNLLATGCCDSSDFAHPCAS